MDHVNEMKEKGGRRFKGIATGPNSTVIPDAVAEFILQTNQFNAETGHSSGGQVNLVTKTGTNSFHRSAYEYFRTGISTQWTI